MKINHPVHLGATYYSPARGLVVPVRFLMAGIEVKLPDGTLAVIRRGTFAEYQQITVNDVIEQGLSDAAEIGEDGII